MAEVDLQQETLTHVVDLQKYLSSFLHSVGASCEEHMIQRGAAMLWNHVLKGVLPPSMCPFEKALQRAVYIFAKVALGMCGLLDPQFQRVKELSFEGAELLEQIQRVESQIRSVQPGGLLLYQPLQENEQREAGVAAVDRIARGG